MKFSIITINLNMGDGLEESILSYLNQKIIDGYEKELIVIDGLSKDNSDKVIHKYSKYINKIVIEKDKGIFDAMNKGISLASGDYIYFLNSGDTFFNNSVLNDVFNYIVKNPNSNIYCGDVATFRNKNYLGLADLTPWIPHQGAFVATNIMRKFKFDINYKIFGDLDLWTRLKNSNSFIVQKLDFVVAKMEMDGVGSDPKYSYKRLKDKLIYAKKHKLYLNWTLSAIKISIGYVIYMLFGRDFYFNKFSLITILIKKILNKPYWAVRIIFRLFYSCITFPFYKLILKEFKFQSFISRNSSILNYNTLSIGKKVEINRNVVIWGDIIKIGDNVQINPGTAIYGNVLIGDNVLIAPNCMLSGGNHSFKSIDIPIRSQGSKSIGIFIEDDVWIGANSVILDGVTIGKGSIVGAGSVVVDSIPPYKIAVGNPCKVIKNR